LTDYADVYLNGGGKSKLPEGKEQDGNDKIKTERDGREENKEC
jgi:hypothetical protein